VLLRSLPVLLALLLTLVAAPQRATMPARGNAAPAACATAFVSASTEQPAPAEKPATSTEPVPADRTAVLFAQCTEGVRGSRAPPTKSA
jgi:hypothetical protein